MLFRLAGLNHDLAEGYNYHPDAAKQLRAAQWFLEGRYFIRLGIHDWDGYPLLNSHLIELVLRGYRAVAQAGADLLGIAVTVAAPDYDENWYFWIARFLNATIGTLAIALAARIGRRSFGVAAGLLAALFLALSPIDVVASHYETAETTTAAFAALALVFALRVLERARRVDYALAAFFVTASFAAKYHGAMSVAPLAVAHVAHWRAREGVLSRRALGRTLWTLGAALLSLLVVVPALWSAPYETIEDFLGYSRFLWESTAERIPELAGAGFLAREAYSLGRQGPVLAHATGMAPLVALAVGAPLLWRRGAAAAVLASMPLLYLGAGIGFRPVVQPVYHTLITLPLYVLLAGLLTAPTISGRARVLQAMVGLACAASLLRGTLRETFFFLHEDSERWGTEWAAENVPDEYARVLGDYTIYERMRSAPLPLPFAGTLFTSGTIRPAPVPDGAAPLARVALEPAAPLPIFRNPTYELSIVAPAVDEARFRIPPLAPRASRFAPDFSFLGARSLLRTDTILEVGPERAASRFVVSSAPLVRPRLVVWNGARANVLTLSFGRKEHVLVLAPGQSAVIAVDGPHTSFPSSAGHELYRLSAESSDGPAWVRVIVDPAAAGWELFRSSRSAEQRDAAAELAAAAHAASDPLLAGAAAVSAAATGTPDPSLAAGAAPLARTVDDRALDAAYGGALDYLSRLSYFEADAAGAAARGFETVADPAARGGQARRALGRVPLAAPELRFELPFFAPGRYRAVVWLRAGGSLAAAADARLIGGTKDERALPSVPLPVFGAGYVPVALRFEIPRREATWSLAIGAAPGSELTVDRLAVWPDPVAEWNGLGNLLRVVSGDVGAPLAATGPADREPLVEYGDRLARDGDVERARAVYARVDALDGVAASTAVDRAARRAIAPLSASFASGVVLDGYRLREPSVPAGGTVHLAVYVEAREPSRALRDAVLWIHFHDEEGRLAFVGDKPLVDALALDPATAERVPPALAIDVPPGVAPGRYRVRVGLTVDGRSAQLRSASAPVAGRGVVLPDAVTVTAR